MSRIANIFYSTLLYSLYSIDYDDYDYDYQKHLIRIKSSRPCRGLDWTAPSNPVTLNSLIFCGAVLSRFGSVLEQQLRLAADSDGECGRVREQYSMCRCRCASSAASRT